MDQDDLQEEILALDAVVDAARTAWSPGGHKRLTAAIAAYDSQYRVDEVNKERNE